MPGAARLGDKAQGSGDAHGCPGCPHPVVGPIVAGSANVNINGRPSARLHDAGIHMACCGPNTWQVFQGSQTVFINKLPAARMGDQSKHCATVGKIIEGSTDVIIGGAPSAGAGGGSGGSSGGGSSGDGGDSSAGGSNATSTGSAANNAANASSTGNGSGSAQSAGSSSSAAPDPSANTSTAAPPETTELRLRLLVNHSSTSTKKHTYVLATDDGSWRQEINARTAGEIMLFTKVPKAKSLRLSTRLTNSSRTLLVLSEIEAV